jgi:hypothetical protein
MRLGPLVALLVVAAFVGVVTIGVVLQIITEQDQAQVLASSGCDAYLGPTQPGQPAQGATDTGNLAPEQRGTASTIIAVGKQRNLAPRAWQVAIQAGMTESGLRNLDHGDRDSLGIFQMRPSMNWGTPAQLQDPNYQVNKFFDVLLTVPGWDQMRPGDAAQAVERSAFPDRYNKWEAIAASLVQNVGQVADVSGCGQGAGPLLPPSPAAAAAIQTALAEQGKPYVWGAVGPDSFDCSGLMLWAYRKAGIILPRVSADQFHARAQLPVRSAQPGDLIFLATDTSNPATIHHVMMYLGGGKVVEAQETGVPVHIRAFSFDEKEVIGQAVRPGV